MRTSRLRAAFRAKGQPHALPPMRGRVLMLPDFAERARRSAMAQWLMWWHQKLVSIEDYAAIHNGDGKTLAATQAKYKIELAVNENDLSKPPELRVEGVTVSRFAWDKDTRATQESSFDDFRPKDETTVADVKGLEET